MTQPPATGDVASAREPETTPAGHPLPWGAPPVTAEAPDRAADARPAPQAPETDVAGEGTEQRPDVEAASAPEPTSAPGQDAAEDAETEPASSSAAAEDDRLILDPWLRQVDAYTGPDALLDFNLVDNVHIDLTTSNPSGYAQLLAGRRTRLSTILRERTALSAGMRSAQAIRAKTVELDAQHGLSAGFLAAGTASWITRDARTGAQRRHIAPVVLAPVSITPHPDGEDFDLRISGGARLNPALVRVLRRDHGVDLEAAGLPAKATSGSRLTPEPVFEALRAVAAGVPGMHVEATTVVSTFADLSDTVGPLPERGASGLLRELSDLNRAQVDAPRQPRALRHRVVDPDELDPAEEVLVEDADDDVSEILQLARAGESLAVTAPAGTGALRAAVNTVAALTEQGRSVLVLAERRESLASAVARLRELGLGQHLLELEAQVEPEQLSADLVRTLVEVERSEAPRLEEHREKLVRTRENLRRHVRSLHRREERWDITPYQAMQTLAALTAKDPAPATRVRFTRAVLDATVDRRETVAQLERAAELRAFSPATRKAPWYGARLVSAEDTQQARALVRHLLQTTRDHSRAVAAAFESVGLRPGASLRRWEEQLQLLQGIRESLTRFRPEVFAEPVTDLIAATASAGWRRERGIDMSAMQRSRLRRAAKEHILAQVHIADLHRALVKVQEQREQWRADAVDDRQVSVPEELDGLVATQRHLGEELAGLEIVMEDSPARRDYPELPVEQLVGVLEEMAGDRFLLDTLPERERLLAVLRGKGLQELLADLERREVLGRRVADELELAWWQSAFEIMLDHPDTALVTGERLAAWESAFRRADLAHVASGPARVRHGIARGWQRRINRRPVQARELRRLLKGAPAPLGTYLQRTPEVLAGLKPVWCASPFAVGRTLPPEAAVDAVVILDAESTPLGACLAALARTEQVIAFGDVHAGYPQPFVVSPTLGAEQEPTDQPVESALEVLSRILPQRTLTRVQDCRDPALLEHLNETRYDGALRALPYGEELVGPVRSLRVDVVHPDRADDRLGAPLIDSPAAEVRAVVEMVFDHAARNPRQSLAVITASPRHAARIAEGVRYGLGRHPELAGFFRPGREPFRVLDLARAAGLRRDRVIFSLGVAPEAGSRPEHFGQLAQEHGPQRFVMAVTAARFHTRIVTSFDVERLEASALRGGMPDLLELMRRVRRRREEEAERARETQGRPEEGPAASSSAFLSVVDPREEEQAADWLLADLARRLRVGGAQVRVSPGEEVDAVATSGRESLSAGAVPSPRQRTAGQGTRGGLRAEDLRFPVGLISDGTRDYAALSVRERSRLRPERMESTGWNPAPVWAVDVFADPQRVADRILGLLGLEPAVDDGEQDDE